ncbi:MAG: hypothetical protein KF850_21715 [Labilithrix sp.]|nr:hypothetical protein [Labilithrix sp.]
MSKLAVSLVVIASVLGCGGGPPVKTASGERIERVTIEERFATSDEVKETTLRGERLRTAVELMDEHDVTTLNGNFESKSVVHTGNVTVIVKPVTGAERRIFVESCAHKKLCPFLEAAQAKGLIERRPLACKSEARCGR